MSVGESTSHPCLFVWTMLRAGGFNVAYRCCKKWQPRGHGPSSYIGIMFCFARVHLPYPIHHGLHLLASRALTLHSRPSTDILVSTHLNARTFALNPDTYHPNTHSHIPSKHIHSHTFTHSLAHILLAHSLIYSLNHTHINNHSLTDSHGCTLLQHTYMSKHIRTLSHMDVQTDTHTSHQEVKRLLAKGIKPDAQKDEVSVFWCRLE